jgi:hypothetical protein
MSSAAPARVRGATARERRVGFAAQSLHRPPLCTEQSRAMVVRSKGDIIMQNLLKLAAIGGALVFALSGCASIIKGSSQDIAISSPPADGATCTLTSKEGSWTVTTPGIVKVDKSKEDVQIVCKKPGWRDGVATIPSDFEGWTLGNLILGGVIGLGVDAATGAINEYPHTFAVPMVQGYSAAENPVSPPSLLPPSKDAAGS